MSKTVGIVGAGASGLVAIKICLEEGLLPTAYERSSTIGGIWNYVEDTSPSSSGRMYKSLVSNVCKISLCYSDFPMSPNVPPYPNHEQYIQYIHVNIWIYVFGGCLIDKLNQSWALIRLRKWWGRVSLPWYCIYHDHGFVRSVQEMFWQRFFTDRWTLPRPNDAPRPP